MQSGGTVIVSNTTYSERVLVLYPMTRKGYKAGWDARYRTPSFGGETTGTNLAFTVTATDKAGNTSTATVHYSVGAPAG